MWYSYCTIKPIQNYLLVIWDLLLNMRSYEEYLFLFHMIRHCFYDGNDDVKNNNGVNDHADNCDNQGWIYFTRLLTVLSVKYM